MEQLPLFKRLPIPRGAVPWRRFRSTVQRCAQAEPDGLQLEFQFRLRALERDIDTEFDYPAHLLVSASGAGAMATDAPRSVFDLARRTVPVMFASMVGVDVAIDADSRIVRKVVEIADGVTRTVGAAYPARWTPEDEERERLRRAKQRPPKPTKQAKTRGHKLLDWIGSDDD